MTGNDLLFSVIIPTYNRADRIGAAIDSVLKQTYTNFEIIVVDDGSTDNTDEVVAEFTDPRIRYYKKKNEERNIARNFGVSQSKGAYVNFLDSDDTVFDHHLEEAKQLITKLNKPEFVYFRIG